eukprot:gnl/Dysnectes_brevis/59_a74_8131.p1 GENE.gnl/Dysnectes_brevis/59_a74_8131~~gnl/Dysnectes_brevis/59_a74_8131.p1  ORF type:complete len:648 (+),score=248.35 gnl/Dysnectes_brevis/59_a74_8131:75-2018(+)
MSQRDLIVSKEGSVFLKNQRRLYIALREYSLHHELNSYFTTPRASMHVVPGIASGELLTHLACTCGAEFVRPADFPEAVELSPSASELLQAFFDWAAEQGVTGTAPAPEDLFDSARLAAALAYIANAFDFLMVHRDIGLQSLPEEADMLPQKEEIKAAIELLGQDVLTISDINDDFETDPSMFKTGAWIIYVSTYLALQGMVCMLVALTPRIRTIVGPADFSSKNSNILAIFNIVQLFASPILNRLSDSIGRKKIMVGCYMLYCLCYFMMTLTPKMEFSGINEYYFLGFWRALSGVSAMIAPIGNTILGDMCPLKQRTHSMAMLNGSAMLGGFSGPFIALIISSRIEDDDAYYRACVLFGSISMGLVAIFVGHVLPETAPLKRAREVMAGLTDDVEATAEKTQADGWFKTFGVVARNRSLFSLIIAYTLTLGAHCLCKDIATPVIMNNLGLGRDAVSLNSAVRGGASFVVSFFILPFVTRWIGERGQTFLGHGILVVGLVGLSNVVADHGQGVDNPATDTHFAVYVAISVFIGISDSFAHPSYLSMCSLFATPQNRGSILGISQFGNSIGRSVPTIIMGYLFGWNNSASFLISLVYPIVAFILTVTAKATIQRSDIEKLSDSKELSKLDVAGHKIDTDAREALEVRV